MVWCGSARSGLSRSGMAVNEGQEGRKRKHENEPMKREGAKHGRNGHKLDLRKGLNSVGFY